MGAPLRAGRGPEFLAAVRHVAEVADTACARARITAVLGPGAPVAALSAGVRRALA